MTEALPADAWKPTPLDPWEGRKPTVQANGQTPPMTTRKVNVTSAAFIIPKRVMWLWDGRVPLGEITLIAGRGGVGKSQLLAWLIAGITTGELDGEYSGTPKDVVLVANEDSHAATVVPRLMAAGADLTRVHILQMKHVVSGQIGSLNLPLDCDAVREVVNDYQAVALFLDPMSSNLKLKNGRNNGDDVREALEDVRRMAEDSGVSVISLAHLRKMASGNVMDAISGSAEFANVVRAVMGCIHDSEYESEFPTYILSQAKNNLGRTDIQSYRYKINTHVVSYPGVEDISTSKIEMMELTDVNVGDIMEDSLTGTTRVGEAVAWIYAYLMSQGGEAAAADVLKASRSEGIAQATLYRAQDRLKIKKVRAGYGASSTWQLPVHTSQTSQVPESSQTSHVSDVVSAESVPSVIET